MAEHEEREEEEVGPDANDGGQTATFEERMACLEEAVDRLESGELSLEEAIAEFESGFRAWRSCQDLLRRAEKRIEVLCEEADAAGELTTEWTPVREKGASPDSGGSTSEFELTEDRDSGSKEGDHGT